MSHIPEVFYLVLDFGKIGRETVIDWEHCSKADIMGKILSGDYGGSLLAVHCIDREFGLWHDVSEDIAQELCDDLNYEPHPDLLNWLQDQLGFQRTNHLIPEIA